MIEVVALSTLAAAGVGGWLVAARGLRLPDTQRLRVVWDPDPAMVPRLAPPGMDIIYVVQAGDTPRRKVGTSTRLDLRTPQLRTGMAGYRPRLCGLLAGGAVLEHRIHDALERSGFKKTPEGERLDGEWFWLTDEAAADWRAVIERVARR